MTAQCIPVGELDVLIMGKVLPIRKAPLREQQAVAETLGARLNERIGRDYPFQVEFGVIEIRDGCIRVKYSLAIILAQEPERAASAVERYSEFCRGAKALWDPASEALEFIAEGRACIARFTSADLIRQLYGPVAEGQDLSQIVAKIDHRGNTQEQAMVAIFEANRERFHEANLNRMKADSVLIIPDASSIAEIPVQRANMQIMKHRRRFEAQKTPD